jgi:hypothetical protein
MTGTAAVDLAALFGTSVTSFAGSSVTSGGAAVVSKSVAQADRR